jgi:hypothetical protein
VAGEAKIKNHKSKIRNDSLGLPVARRTQKVNLVERIRAWRNARAKQPGLRDWNWVVIVKVMAVIGFLAGSGAFLRYAEAYVKMIAPVEEGSLVLVAVPGWADCNLRERVAEVAGGKRFPLTEETAALLARNLALMAWLHDVDVQVTHNSVRVKAQWRKPVAVIDIPEDRTKIYVDADLVVLDYLEMPHLPIVELKGVGLNVVPRPGQRYDQPDVAAGVALIALLGLVDADQTPQSRLLDQIASVDVRNFKGRKNAREPHIVLRSKDDTQIIWGAELGEWTKHGDATDEDKVGKLLTYYRDNGSLNAGVKYINLCDPRDRLPKPIEKYRNWSRPALSQGPGSGRGSATAHRGP